MSFTSVRRLDDQEQRVAKFVFEGVSAVAEAVLYRYPDYETRTVICCSTQSGCPVGCRSCGAGDFFVRTLTLRRDCRSGSALRSFGERLLRRGFDVRIFDPAGQDTIGGGCGQLWFVQDWLRTHPEKARPSVGHGKDARHTPVLPLT